MLGYSVSKALICRCLLSMNWSLSLCLAAWLRVPAVNIWAEISKWVKWKSKFQFKLIWPRIFDFEQLFWRYPIQKYPEKCYNPCYEVCLFAWQTDDWSSLRKNKFHPSNIKNEVGFGRLGVVPGGYLSASFMVIPAGKCQSSGETNIDLLDGIFVL